VVAAFPLPGADAPAGRQGIALPQGESDERYSADLADPLGMGRLPEAWTALHDVRGLDKPMQWALTWCACEQLRRLGARCAGQAGIPVTCPDIFGTAGQCGLDALDCRRALEA